MQKDSEVLADIPDADALNSLCSWSSGRSASVRNHRCAKKKGPSFGRKAEARCSKDCRESKLYFVSTRRIKRCSTRVPTLIRRHDLHHHSGDFLRACFIPAFFLLPRRCPLPATYLFR